MSAPVDAPKRIQQSRTAGWRKPSGAVSVARPGPWGNPFPAHDFPGGRAEAVERYRRWLTRQPRYVARARAELAGKTLMCWCPLDEPCHADVLLALVNDLGDTE